MIGIHQTQAVERLNYWARDLALQIAARSMNSSTLYERACSVIPGGVTRHILYEEPYPSYWVSARDCYLVDADENEYLDFCLEYTAALYGHANPHLSAAIQRVFAEGVVRGGPSEEEVRFAECLQRRFGFEQVRFSNSGTEANIIALGLARCYTGKGGVAVFSNSYHGGVLDFEPGGGKLNVPGAYHVLPLNDWAVIKFIRETANLSAVLFELIQVTDYCRPADVAWLEEVVVTARAVGAVVIFDEIVTSRLGPGGFQSELGITPDLTTLGKYIGGGLTLSAIGGAEAILSSTDARRASSVEHHGTFNNNLPGMVAGRMGLEDLFTAAACVQLNQCGDHFRGRLNTITATGRIGLRFRGTGSVMSPYVDGGSQVLQVALRRALVRFLMTRNIFVGNIALINLCLNHGTEHLDKFADALCEFVEESDRVLSS